ncbi:MAG: M1 family metallopeptidase [Gammaproteobacteria bacterium]|nr:M1 family metallopeptidase [Gammaproteobacteria bacterium]
MLRFPLLLAALLPLASHAAVDVHSYGNPDEVQVKHVALDLDADFDRKVLDGTATLTVERKDATADLVVDTRALDVHKTEISVDGDWLEVPYVLGEEDDDLGTPLTVLLSSQDAPESEQVRIHYTTSPQASGLQWLTPEQTASGEPFLFSQAQPIEARSFVPLQDSPGVRVTYEAVLRTPENLLATMSADMEIDAERDGEYAFNMPQAIPPYLIAIAVGKLEFEAMSKRTGVYAEPYIVENAAEEFSGTEKMMEVTEALYGPYRWDRYDLMILPPSFPFGGMENPRLSFITPTVVAGDKSLVALIAHELAHSWSGNLVTNATWRDFWLNEGFTTYLTYRIMEEVYGERRARMEHALGYQDLQGDLADFEPHESVLNIELGAETHPDDVFSNIPYEKGALFLTELEDKVGRKAFDEFLRNYFDHFAFQSITTQQFEDYLKKNLVARFPKKLDWDRIQAWIHEPGLPDGHPVPQSDAFSKIDQVRENWLEDKVDAGDIETDEWSVHEWLYFLNTLPDTLAGERMRELDIAFDLTNTKNAEIAHSWLMNVVRNDYRPAFDRLENYLVSIGRRKLIQPLYRALMESGKEKHVQFAKRVYKEARPGYHPMAQNTMDGIVGKPE